ncbi:substrate-binding domain-containing protein [Streptomyces lycii]|uniref:Phosphate ABC transporter substrate-binding protein n=1 Tax=Streptomyces lycii TaxID=2654337 RepID=A0ABQ7F8F6_9ACTN|nr:substrate-binding domain-containing protein [Streptomyces lycii]KAF4405166.1 phosphate ABC transporter substrate-binding protein [Streptomyces lycii]
MDFLRWEIVLAVLGVVVPIAAALYEFIVVGRKRLGYRVQMDTTATEAVHSRYAGALQQLQDGDGTRLVDPSFVLLRIENNGATHIDTDDYAVLPDDKVGIRVRFPGRRVAGLVVTELSDSFLRPCFNEDSGLSVRDGVIELPKVPLNRAAHYKVLAALERTEEDGVPGDNGEAFPEPEIVGGIKGGVGNGGVQETESRTGASRQVIALIVFLVLVVLGQLAVSLADDETPAPLDCATGRLTLTGSTAFRDVLVDAAASYRKTCPGSDFRFATEGSGQGLRTLDAAGRDKKAAGMLAFTDGAKGDGYPQLLPRPLAFSLFTMVVNKEAGVQDLSLRQIRDVYAGRVTNWEELGGNDMPVRLVGRFSTSGSRKTFQRHVLDGRQEPPYSSDNCRERAAGAAEQGPLRCERNSTGEVLDAVAGTPGALGYSGLGEASGRRDLLLLSIDGRRAGLEGADYGAYPFWETEYAHTYGEPEAGSLAASFLRYLTNEVGKDVIRSHGHRPCAELQNPVLCRPVARETQTEASAPAG